MSRFTQSVPANELGSFRSDYVIEKPQRSPDVSSDVIVPFLQAMITALVLGTGLVTLLWGIWALPYWPTWPVATAGILVFAWIWRLAAVSETLWVSENILGLDLDRDGTVGRPVDHDHIIVAGAGSQLSDSERQQAQKRAQFVQFVRALSTGDTSRERFEGTLGRQRYEEFRDALIGGKLARWVDPGNHRRGWTLVADPEGIIRGIM